LEELVHGLAHKFLPLKSPSIRKGPFAFSSPLNAVPSPTKELIEKTINLLIENSNELVPAPTLITPIVVAPASPVVAASSFH
jgi:hypothetical protein